VHQRAQRTTSPINDIDMENFPVDFGVVLAIASCYSTCTTT
jgi:hypothetical protein